MDSKFLEFVRRFMTHTGWHLVRCPREGRRNKGSVMPAMRVFGRRSALATDDFFLIGCIDFLVFLPWISWAPVVYASYLQHRPDCEDRESLLLLDIWLPALNALVAANWLLAASFALVSGRGSISQPEPRRHVVTLVYVKLVISFLDVGCASLGTYLFVRGSYCSVLGVPSLLQASTIFLWFATVVRLAMMIFLYDWGCGKATSKEGKSKEFFDTPVRNRSCKKWHLRLQAAMLWCTTPNEGRKQALQIASELLAIISIDLDLVASDMLAGLLLYRKKCFQWYKKEKEKLVELPPISTSDGMVVEKFPPDDWPPWMNLKQAHHFMDLGMNIYGWYWFLYRNLACGCCKLLAKITCCFRCRKASQNIRRDNCCGCMTAGMLAYTGLPLSDVVFVDYNDKVFELPYSVCVDHTYRAVLISVRGTMSMDDVLTDVTGDFDRMGGSGIYADAICHRGMLYTARRLKEKLHEDGVLEMAAQVAPGYDLVMTGHSLGAAVATMLTLMLLPDYPTARCFAFAPPPCVDASLLEATRECVFSLVYGNDTVMSIKYDTVQTVIDNMVQCIAECKVPKFKVFINSEKMLSNNSDEEINSHTEVLSKSNGSVKPSGSYGTVSPGRKGSSSKSRCNTFVAGRILHIRRTKAGYRLRLAKAQDYDQILFRPHMVYHHFPDLMLSTVAKLGKEDFVVAADLAKPPPSKG